MKDRDTLDEKDKEKLLNSSDRFSRQFKQFKLNLDCISFFPLFNVFFIGIVCFFVLFFCHNIGGFIGHFM